MAVERPPYFHPRHDEVRYRTVLVDGSPPWRAPGLVATPFRIAERSAGSATLIVFPGFGVSVGRIGVDRLLWHESPRYGRIITHDAVNYRTRVDYLIWQYVSLLDRLPPGPISMLGMSLGGATAIELLFHLQKTGSALYARCAKLLTLVSAVLDEDYQPRWRRALRLIRMAAEPGTPRGEVERLLRSTMLRVIARAIRSRIQDSCVEADTCDEIIASFGHMAESYAPERPRPAPASLPGIEIVSVGIADDDMVANARACRYGARPGRYVVCSGRHTPDFYSAAQETYDRLILDELG